MKNHLDLQKMLLSMDGKGYPAYKALKGNYAFGNFTLWIDHVQSDPYAPPSKMRVQMPKDKCGLPEHLIDNAQKRRAVSDFLTRCFASQIRRLDTGAEATGGSGRFLIDRPGQEILDRTSVLIAPAHVELRFELGLPAAGRRALGQSAAKLLIQQLPLLVQKSLVYGQLDQRALAAQVALVLEQAQIRQALVAQDLVAFVADGAILPRESGISDKPMRQAIAFQSPESLRVQLELPEGKTISGMGIPKGITLLVGGGYHGKSTLLRALERGVYDHIPGDGREYVITLDHAVKVRSEDGRSVQGVNISPFINHLPGGKDTASFSTENASGSTSQAANVIEAIQAGCGLLLIDEDTSATNFMIRDGRMQQLVAKDKEPITPFIDQVEALYRQQGISTILIVGGSGDYFDVAHRVLMMDAYVPKDVSQRAKEISQSSPTDRQAEARGDFARLGKRIPLPASFPQGGREDRSVARAKARGLCTVSLGRENIDLDYVEQLVSPSQTNALAVMLAYYLENLADGRRSLEEAADLLYAQISAKGLESLSPYTGHPGNMALPRKQEFCAMINRYRGLKIR